MTDSRQRLRAVGMLMLATPCWALSFPVMKALALEQQKLLPGGNSWFLTALGVIIRFGVAGALLLPLLFRSGRKPGWRELEQGILLAAFGGGGILFQMDGLVYTKASTSAFLTQAYAMFIPIWVALTLRRRPPLKTFLGVALVLAGVAVLANVNLREFRLGRGELETIIASLLFTGQILTLELPRYRENRPMQFSVAMFFSMAVFSVPLLLATMPSIAACGRAFASIPACGLMGVLVVVCTLMGYIIMNRWQPRVSATEAGLIYCIEPVCASAMALFLPALFSAWAEIDYPNEQLTMRLIAGGGLITAANVLVISPWLNPKS